MIIVGDALTELTKLPYESVDCCVTSPPYWGLRDYGVEGQAGLEPTPDEYVRNMVGVFTQVRRVLKNNGTLWLNLGDSYTSGNRKSRDHDKKLPARHLDKRPKTPYLLKPKDLVGIPWMVAFALRADGWYLRSDIIWHKSSCLPESVRDRPTKAHEYIFLLAKNQKYYYDADSIREPHAKDSLRRTKRKFVYKHQPPGQTRHTLTPNGFCNSKGKNKRSVWCVSTKRFNGAHFATFPTALIEPCVKAGCPVGGTVLDPFFGAGTTGLVASQLNRKFIGIELNPTYAEIARERIGLEAL